MSKRTRLDRIFGGSPFRLDVYLPGLSTELAGTIPGTRLANLTAHRGRAGAREDPQAGTLTFTVTEGLTVPPVSEGGVPTELDTAQGLALVLDADRLAAAIGAANVPAQLVRFIGRVSDLGDLEIRANQATADVPVTAATLLAKLGNHPLDSAGVDFPDDTPPLDVVLGVLAEAWNNDPALQMGPFSAWYTDWLDRIIARQPDTSAPFLAWDARGQSAPSVLSEVAAQTGGTLIDRADGHLDWLRPADRSAAERAPLGAAFLGVVLPNLVDEILDWVTPTRPPIRLDASIILAPAVVAKTLASVVNYQEATYGIGGASTTWAADPLSIDRYGYLPGEPVATRYAELADASQLAGTTVGRYGLPGWHLSTVTVDVLALIESGQLATAGAVLSIDLGALVELTGLPSTSPVPDGRYFVEALDDAITAKSWRVTFGLVEYALLAQPLTWDDLPADLTWDDYGLTVSWDRATSWLPG